MKCDPLHGSAVFLRQMVDFSRTQAVTWENSHTISCVILFSLFQIILIWNNEVVQNQMEITWSRHFRGWFFIMEWFWLFYVAWFLFYVLSWYFPILCKFSDSHVRKQIFLSGDWLLMQRGFWKRKKAMQYFFLTFGTLYQVKHERIKKVRAWLGSPWKT